MKTVIIIKLGSYIVEELDDINMNLPILEPKNFGNILIDENIFGRVIFASDYNNFNDERVQFLDITDMDNLQMFVNYFDSTDVDVIFWQGAPMDYCIRTSNTYRAFGVLKELPNANNSFIVTDVRLPFLQMGNELLEDYSDYSYIDMSDTNLVVQAHDVDMLEYDMKNGLFDCRHADLTFHDIETNFKSYVYLPLHYMPLFTHYVEVGDERLMNMDLIYTTQSLSYMGEERLDTFKHYMFDTEINSCFNVGVYARMRPLDQVIFDKLSDYDDVLKPQLLGEIPFNKLKYELNKSDSQLCITEKQYNKYDLIPNRVMEGIATGCVPLMINDNINNYSVDPNYRIYDKINGYCGNGIADLLLIDTKNDIFTSLNYMVDYNVAKELQKCIEPLKEEFVLNLETYFNK